MNGRSALAPAHPPAAAGLSMQIGWGRTSSYSLMPSHTPRILALSTNATDEELTALADDIAHDCAARRKPRVAAATVWVHARRQKAPESTVSRLAAMVAERLMLADPARPKSASIPQESFADVATAAVAYGLRERTLAERLRYVRWRRLYGWPHWDGHSWKLPVTAYDPLLRNAYLAQQPAEEPAAHVRMLPTWCERVDGEGIPRAGDTREESPS